MAVSLPPLQRRCFASRLPSSAVSIGLLVGVSLGLAGTVPVAFAQDAAPSPSVAPPPPKVRFLLPLLREVNYDPVERGPLLVVAPSAPIPPNVSLPEGRTSLTPLANATNMRLFPAGQMHVLAGRTMTVLNANPGKANPFGGMESSELLKLMLSSFTPAQWGQVGSVGGIGKGDLTEEQSLLWDGIFPARMRVQTSTANPGPTPGSEKYTDTTLTDILNRDSFRLRINRQVNFTLIKQGTEDLHWGGNPYSANRVPGEKRQFLLPVRDGSAPNQRNSAFGVPLISEQPRRLKTGAIDFAAQALNARVSLIDFPPLPETERKPIPPNTPPEALPHLQMKTELAELPTVGALLERVTQATGLEFIADRRIRDLPVYLRGESARAGDLLMALAIGVAGAYRSIEPGVPGSVGVNGRPDTAPLYLLTDDVQGIGARVALLDQWGKDANDTKKRMMEGVAEKTARSNPLAHITFAPEDKFALPEAWIKALEEGWRKRKFERPPAVSWNDLSPTLRDAVQKFVNERQEDGVYLRTDRVHVGMELQACILIPEINAVIKSDGLWEDLSADIGYSYIEALVHTPNPANKAKEAPEKPASRSALGFAAPHLKGQRRVLIARPANATEAVTLVCTAASRGITDLWLEVTLKDPDASARLLTAAIKAASGKIAVGGAVRLLKDSGIAGEVERNILGETGDEFRARLIAHYALRQPGHNPDWFKTAFSGYAGWVVPDEMDLVQHVRKLAAVRGLAGLALRASGAPGWTGVKYDESGVWMNARLGYTPTLRRAFLREKGIDPIDIPEYAWTLNDLPWNLGYFIENDRPTEYRVVNNRVLPQPEDGFPRVTWWAFRKRLNTALLSGLFQSIQKAAPGIAVYLETPVRPYNGSNADWFASWESADRLPECPSFLPESETRANLRRTSRRLFVHWSMENDTDAKKPDAPALFARRATDAAHRHPPPNWDGIVIDITSVPGNQAVRLLTGLPTVP